MRQPLPLLPVLVGGFLVLGCSGAPPAEEACTDGDQRPCYSGPTGSQNQGACRAGFQTCTGGSFGACVDEVLPAQEACNGMDDNCDGNVDEGCGCVHGATQSCYSGSEATRGVGACVDGQQVCTHGAFEACVGDVLPGEEVCDGVDNDCDGQVDNGNPGGGQACATGLLGVCAQGTTACTGGEVVCNANAQPTAEACDGLDNDCDGAVDNGDPGSGQACNTGLVGVCSVGTTACTGGALLCNANVEASAEVCDGQDNDCDGEVDNGDPGGGEACDTGQPGVCEAGSTTCEGGSVTCQAVVAASPELCDGLDNNCDGLVDEGDPGGGTSCNTGLPGACAQGALTCANGALSCMQTHQPTAEVCANGIDDDCDGLVDEDEDADADGWGRCGGGDCCDLPGACGAASPHLVNPGAMEIMNNGVDDDCDAATSDTQFQSCSIANDFSATALALSQAMDLCQSTTLNAPLPQKRWGLINATLTSADLVAPAPTLLQRAVKTGFGTAVTPVQGSTLAVLSSGTARAAADPGFISPQGTGYTTSSVGNPPPVYLAAHGGVLQSAPGCPAGSGARDSTNLRLQIRVPTNATQLKLRYKFYTAEFPEWVCSEYNDFFLALLDSQAPGIPADRNIAYDAVGNPVTVNAGFLEVCQGCPLGTAELQGTGFPETDAAGTAWLETTAPVVPGEVITLELIIFDVGDNSWDSTVLLDALRFEP